MKLFVAFDSRDQAVASTLVDVLRKWFPSGLRITYTPEFFVGVEWLKRLNTALRNHDALLVVCTRRSVENRWVIFESGAFFGRKKPTFPVVAGRLRPDELPQAFQRLQIAALGSHSEMKVLARTLARRIGREPAGNPAEAAELFRTEPETGGIESQHESVSTMLTRLRLRPNGRANQVMSAAPSPNRLAIDDFICLFISPNWEGLQKHEVVVEMGEPRRFPAEVVRVAREYRKTRPDRRMNMRKLALARLDPLMTDRDQLRLGFEPMRYFDFEGPRRNLYEGDRPTSFAHEHYLGRQIPEGVATPLTCVHTILLTRDESDVVVGLRRSSTKADFYDHHLCVGFEEQMEPDDRDVWGTVRRGLLEETGVGVADDDIRILAIGLEASFFSVSVLAVARLDVTARQLHDSIQTRAVDHEWDALFLRNDTAKLTRILSRPLPARRGLGLKHFLEFSPASRYEWHGTSRARLFAYLAHKEGLGRLSQLR